MNISLHCLRKSRCTLRRRWGLCKVVRALASRPECWDKRHLLLGDNLSLCLSASKGRCVQPLMLMILRRIAFFSVACGLILSCRWLPSEHNLADALSRRREPKRQGRRDFGKIKAGSGASAQPSCESGAAGGQTAPGAPATTTAIPHGCLPRPPEQGEAAALCGPCEGPFSRPALAEAEPAEREAEEISRGAPPRVQGGDGPVGTGQREEVNRGDVQALCGAFRTDHAGPHPAHECTAVGHEDGGVLRPEHARRSLRQHRGATLGRSPLLLAELLEPRLATFTSCPPGLDGGDAALCRRRLDGRSLGLPSPLSPTTWP